MLLEKSVTKKLLILQKQTGKPMNELVNEILDIHLNRKNEFLCNEIDKLFSKYKSTKNKTHTFS